MGCFFKEREKTNPPPPNNPPLREERLLITWPTQLLWKGWDASVALLNFLLVLGFFFLKRLCSPPLYPVEQLPTLPLFTPTSPLKQFLRNPNRFLFHSFSSASIWNSFYLLIFRLFQGEISCYSCDGLMLSGSRWVNFTDSHTWKVLSISSLSLNMVFMLFSVGMTQWVKQWASQKDKESIPDNWTSLSL